MLGPAKVLNMPGTNSVGCLLDFWEEERILKSQLRLRKWIGLAEWEKKAAGAGDIVRQKLSQEKLSWAERPEKLLTFGAASVGKTGRWTV